jgi:alpha,alpha-trehalase
VSSSSSRIRSRALAAPAFVILWCVAALAAAKPPEPPSVIFGELFEAVQLAGLFEDSKTFADAIPRREAADILAAYRAQRSRADFDLRAFVEQHFSPPAAPPAYEARDRQASVCAHIDALWPVLTRAADEPSTRGSLLPLPHRYVVPGGRFREVYYWDSYFTMLGLEAQGRHELVREMLANFAFLIDQYGHVPNGNRSYYLSRSQPPFFAAMVSLVAARDGEATVAKFLPQLQREHDYWMHGAERLARGQAQRRVVRLPSGERLNRYWDDRATPRDEAYREDIATARQSRRPRAEVYRNLRAAAESGWDFSSRWLEDGRTLARIRTVELLPVDLNSLLHHLESVIARGHAAAGDDESARRWRALAETRAQAIRRVFWNPARRTYTDYDWARREPSNQVTAASVYPLYFGIATPEQARDVAAAVRLYLLRPEGLVPTSVASGQQWDAPNGWPPLQWLAIQGLERQGEPELARAIALRWRDEVEGEFARRGKLVEKYDVTGDATAKGGEYPTQDGFGWTNGTYAAAHCAR